MAERFTGEEVIRVTGAEGVVTTLELAQGEQIKDFAMGDREAWHAAVQGNLFVFKPKEVRAETNLTLFTDRRAYDLMMFDPPYGSGGAGALIEKMTRLGWAAETAWAAVETRNDEQVSADGWTLDVERRYGIAKLSVLCRTAPARSG